MTRLLRITGFLLIGGGALVLLVWAIRPLRVVWSALLALPPAIQIGMGAAGLGLVVLMGSLIAERSRGAGGGPKAPGGSSRIASPSEVVAVSKPVTSPTKEQK